jgi:hypothetical protein
LCGGLDVAGAVGANQGFKNALGGYTLAGWNLLGNDPAEVVTQDAGHVFHLLELIRRNQSLFIIQAPVQSPTDKLKLGWHNNLLFVSL